MSIVAFPHTFVKVVAPCNCHKFRSFASNTAFADAIFLLSWQIHSQRVVAVVGRCTVCHHIYEYRINAREWMSELYGKCAIISICFYHYYHGKYIIQNCNPVWMKNFERSEVLAGQAEEILRLIVSFALRAKCLNKMKENDWNEMMSSWFAVCSSKCGVAAPFMNAPITVD